MVAKKALTALSEATTCNCVVGLTRKRSGSEEGTDPAVFLTEPLHKRDESDDLSTLEHYVTLRGPVIREEADITKDTVPKTNDASKEHPVLTGAESTDPKSEPGKILDGITASVDETSFDIRCPRDTKIYEKSDKDCPCCDSGGAEDVHVETTKRMGSEKQRSTTYIISCPTYVTLVRKRNTPTSLTPNPKYGESPGPYP